MLISFDDQNPYGKISLRLELKLESPPFQLNCSPVPIFSGIFSYFFRIQFFLNVPWGVAFCCAISIWQFILNRYSARMSKSMQKIKYPPRRHVHNFHVVQSCTHKKSDEKLATVCFPVKLGWLLIPINHPPETI